jgi:signal transduction histidine kinase
MLTPCNVPDRFASPLMTVTPQELTALALDLLPQAVLIADIDGKILVRNIAGEELLPEGEDIHQVLTGGAECAIHWETDIAALDEGPGKLAHHNVSLGGRDNRQHTVDIHLRRLQEGERTSGVLVVITDVSDRVTMERRSAATERFEGVGEVAARVAHELNNPLDAVLRFIGLAERVAGEPASQYLQGARDGLMRMAEIIRDLRQQGGLRTAGPRNSPVERLLDEAIRAMQPRAQALGVAIVCDLAEDASIPVEAGVFQVFCNVIRNAMDAMPEGGLLNVRLRRVGDNIVVDFTDTGCGISADQVEEIFQPFYTTKPPGEGSGLGLAISRDILSRSGGTISASPGKSGGTRISIRLPVPKQPQEMKQQ